MPVHALTTSRPLDARLPFAFPRSITPVIPLRFWRRRVDWRLGVTKNDLGDLAFATDGRLLVSFPKSGRTWIDFALSTSGLDIMLTHAGCSTNRREIGRPFAGVLPTLARLPLVFLHRDPIDTAVSLFHHVTHRDLRRGSARYWRMFLPLMMRQALLPRSIDAFVLHPTHGIDKICRFNRAWLDHLQGRDDCLILTYEGMRAAPDQGLLDGPSKIELVFNQRVLRLLSLRVSCVSFR